MNFVDRDLFLEREGKLICERRKTAFLICEGELKGSKGEEEKGIFRRATLHSFMFCFWTVDLFVVHVSIISLWNRRTGTLRKWSKSELIYSIPYSPSGAEPL
jgi:hypothetical protein